MIVRRIREDELKRCQELFAVAFESPMGMDQAAARTAPQGPPAAVPLAMFAAAPPTFTAPLAAAPALAEAAF